VIVGVGEIAMGMHNLRYLFLILLTFLLLTSSVIACANTILTESKVPSLKIAPQIVKSGETVSISTQIRNIGGSEENHTVVLTVDDAKVQTKVVRVAPGKTEIVTFTVIKNEPGTYNVEVNNLKGSFRVLKSAEFAISNLLIAPKIAEPGQAVTVTANISNSGEVEGSHSIALVINGSQVESKDSTVAPGATKTVSFTFSKNAVGSYSVEVDGLSGLAIVAAADSILTLLNAVYPELYHELLKLPDLQEIDDKDNEAIEDIAYLALNPKYKTAFESMLNEGIRDKRKYCTPLEALLWIAYDNEFDGYNPVSDYSLTKLINDAWTNTNTSKNFISDTWRDFDKVVDRLNSPKLVEIYMQNNYSYSYTKGEAEGVKSAEQIFKDKKGACYDHAVLAFYYLKKNGYDKAQCLFVAFDRPAQGYFLGHIVCVYQDPKDSLYYIVDNAGGSRVHGPFDSIEKAAENACVRGSFGEANLRRYSLHDIDLATGKYKTVWELW